MALVIINAHQFSTRGRIRALPVEIEVLLLLMILLELVGGDALGLYIKLPHYELLLEQQFGVLLTRRNKKVATRKLEKL